MAMLQHPRAPQIVAVMVGLLQASAMVFSGDPVGF